MERRAIPFFIIHLSVVQSKGWMLNEAICNALGEKKEEEERGKRLGWNAHSNQKRTERE